jgi:hypothetical protein
VCLQQSQKGHSTAGAALGLPHKCTICGQGHTLQSQVTQKEAHAHLPSMCTYTNHLKCPTRLLTYWQPVSQPAVMEDLCAHTWPLNTQPSARAHRNRCAHSNDHRLKQSSMHTKPPAAAADTHQGTSALHSTLSSQHRQSNSPSVPPGGQCTQVYTQHAILASTSCNHQAHACTRGLHHQLLQPPQTMAGPYCPHVASPKRCMQ